MPRKAYRMLGIELCVTRGRSHAPMELVHMRSQLRRSTTRQVKIQLMRGKDKTESYERVCSRINRRRRMLLCKHGKVSGISSRYPRANAFSSENAGAR